MYLHTVTHVVLPAYASYALSSVVDWRMGKLPAALAEESGRGWGFAEHIYCSSAFLSLINYSYDAYVSMDVQGMQRFSFLVWDANMCVQVRGKEVAAFYGDFPSV
jgi:hypothetical protein